MAEQKIFGVTVNTDALKNLPESYKMIAGGVLSLLILLGSGYYLLYPIYDEYKILLEENEKLSGDNQALESKLGYNPTTKTYSRIEEANKQIEGLTKEIEKLQERIPQRENIPSLIYDLEKMTEQDNKSDLLDLVPSALQSVSLPDNLKGGAQADLNLSQTPINLSIESSYPSLISLFKDFERYQRAINPSSLSLSSIKNPTDKFSALKVTLNLKAYVLPEGGK